MKSSICTVRLFAMGVFAAALAFVGEARAFCRAVTRAPPAGWNVTAQGCYTDSVAAAKSLFWKNLCIGYSVHSKASRVATLEQATVLTAAAFEAWTSATCPDGSRPSLQAVNLGPVDCGKAQFNGDQGNQNVILFHDDVWPHGASDKTLGLTTITFDTGSGEILGADMEINATQNLVIGDDVPPGSYSLASVLTHEVGHFLGLAHSAESSAVMFAQYRPTSPLANDDAQGICAIYAPSGARATTDGPVASGPCDPTPPRGFISACTSPGSSSDSLASESSGGCSLGRRPAAGRRHAALPGIAGLALFVWRRRRGRSRAAQGG